MTPALTFTDTETDLLGRTADALSAYLGKPVVAEVVTESDGGFEWVLFAIPLMPGEDLADSQAVQVGGPGARFLGNLGGLTLDDDQPLECEFLWAIQLSDLEGVRYIKVDAEGDEVAWTDALPDLLPFDLQDLPADDDSLDGDDEGNDEDDDGYDPATS